MASGERQSNPSTSGDAGGDHNKDYDEYGPPLPTQDELREMDNRRLVGEATNMMLNFAKDPKLAKYMTETVFQDVHAQWKATTTSPPKPDSKKQYSGKELEQEVEARLARILGAQDKGKKHDKKRKKSTDFPGYLDSVIEGDYNIFKRGVREMPNVLILPRSADYSEEVWMEIRAKAITILRSFLLDGVVPSSAVSDEDDDDRDYAWQEDKQDKQEKDNLLWSSDQKTLLGDAQSGQDLRHKQMYFNTPDPRLQDGGVSQSISQRERSHGKGAGRKGKKRPGRRKSQRSADSLATERETNWVALQRDDLGARISGRDQVLSSSSRFASPEDSKTKREGELITEDVTSERRSSLGVNNSACGQGIDLLKEGYVVALRAAGGSGYHVARQRGPGRGWCLDTMSNVTIRDPAVQFLVVLRNRDRIGLRSLAAGGKLLQANKKLELVFVNHTFDVWESWMLEGTVLRECRLTNCKFRTVSLDIAVEILAVIGEEDGVARWLS
ncbi:hypothetical protein L7F22_044747 [Adiantum nelumboides]|nr:hypothetical protein [Adiantum nelumboides]